MLTVVQGYSRDADFPRNVNFSRSVTWRFCVTREEVELLNDVRDFFSLFYVILRRESSKWL